MTEITDAIRAGVLGAISRGMSLDYAARADGIRVAEAEEIARAAGWPDRPLDVLAEHRRLTGTPAAGKPLPVLVAMCGSCGVPLKDCAGHYPVPPAELVEEYREFAGAVGEMLDRAEQEYFGQVPPTGPTPGHLEPLESYVARVAAPIEASLTAELGVPGVRVKFDTRPLLEEPTEAEPLVWDRTELIEEDPLPPATDSPAPAPVKRSATRPGTLPCEVCGGGVTLAYIEANGGRRRHGHHPEGA